MHLPEWGGYLIGITYKKMTVHTKVHLTLVAEGVVEDEERQSAVCTCNGGKMPS